ncbi:hypothetical protein ACKQTC_08525 [Peptococcus simiae]|uniref:Uncharacterized protein n=1 Tax=Peptococcus simiae TaxID=1643805 RepID=A0ABW9H0N8_9FIRM
MREDLMHYTKQFQDTMEDLDMDIKKGLVNAKAIILMGILMDQIANAIRKIMMDALADQERERRANEDITD